jgi:hypothetical protein
VAPRNSGLQVVVALNEASKAMSEHSFEVRLRALDALMRSVKNTGAALPGFREVSLQMRQWSDDLSAQLEELRKICAEAVGAESRQRTLDRRARLLTEASRQCAHGELQVCVDAFVLKEKTSRRARRKQLDVTIEQLTALKQLGLMAIVLARTAMIEATAAQPEERVVLSQVSREFGEHAQAVLKLAKDLTPLTNRAALELS